MLPTSCAKTWGVVICLLNYSGFISSVILKRFNTLVKSPLIFLLLLVLASWKYGSTSVQFGSDISGFLWRTCGEFSHILGKSSVLVLFLRDFSMHSCYIIMTFIHNDTKKNTLKCIDPYLFWYWMDGNKRKEWFFMVFMYFEFLCSSWYIFYAYRIQGFKRT